MKDLTYDMNIELLSRTCKALDYSQQEIEKLKKENEKLRKENSEYQDEIFARDNSWFDMQD